MTKLQILIIALTITNIIIFSISMILPKQEELKEEFTVILIKQDGKWVEMVNAINSYEATRAWKQTIAFNPHLKDSKPLILPKSQAEILLTYQ